jgi:glycosyltransferase involved in cell wall biosynthesis
MNISIAITTFNRYEMTVESFAQVLDDPRIDDIVILDDCSTDGSYEKLVKHFKDVYKVRVIRQAKNRGMGQNKRDAIAYAKNEWVAIIDSDNVIGPDYFDWFNNREIFSDTIYCPSFAKPKFDYRKFENELFSVTNIDELIQDEMGYCLLNTCNYIVHRDTYLKVYQQNETMKGTDTIWFNYLWLKAGYCFYIVRGMEYLHRVHNGSGFIKDLGYNMKQAEKVKKMILSL